MNHKMIRLSRLFIPIILFIVIMYPTITKNNDLISNDLTEQVIDLTELSNLMAYVEVTNIKSNPVYYIGKTIIINGIYTSYYDNNIEKDIACLLFYDTMKCCKQELEIFLLKQSSGRKPQEGEIIKISGIYKYYIINEIKRFYVEVENWI